MDLIGTLLRDVPLGGTILDIGANVGDYTYTFRQHCPDAVIHCFEPVPSVFATLEKRHGRDVFVHCWNLGVGAQRETVTGVAVHEAWTINQPGETKRGRNATYGRELFDMQVTTVDSFLMGWPQAGGSVNAIKIDTDGYDFRVLQGAKQTIARCRPRILIELGYCIVDLDGVSAIWNTLVLIDELGYAVYDEHGERKPVTRLEYESWYPYHTTADFLLVPAEQELKPQP